MWIMVIVLATSNYTTSGASAVQVEFTSQEKCIHAINSLSTMAQDRRNYILTKGCFKK
jgi:hypothetical protein